MNLHHRGQQRPNLYFDTIHVLYVSDCDERQTSTDGCLKPKTDFDDLKTEFKKSSL
jgi:hypothetical protein